MKHRPEVVLGFNDLSWMWLNAAIPDPASRPDFAALALHPAMQRVSGMFHDPRRFAAAAADSVDHQVRHGIRGPLRQSHDILVPLEWIDGGTCRFSTG